MRALQIAAAGAVASTVLALAGMAGAEPSVVITNAVVRVTVVPEARADVKVEIQSANPKLPLRVGRSGSQTVIDGGLEARPGESDRVTGCDTESGQPAAHVRGVGDVAWADMPRILIRTPMTVDLSAGGAVFGAIGPSDTVEFNSAGCGAWTVADVKGLLEVNQAGSSDITAGRAGAVEIHLDDAGTINTQAVAGDLEVYLAGSGVVTASSAAGKFEAHVAGPGHVTVAGGRSTAVEVSVLSSGQVDFGGVAGEAEVSVAGSGAVRIAKVEGPVRKSVAGAGQVTIGH